MSLSQQALRDSQKVFQWSKRTLLHRFLEIWGIQTVSAQNYSILICCSLHERTSLNLLFNREMSPMRAPGTLCLCICPSKLTFTIFEDPLAPSLTERPLVRVNYPQYLQLPAHQVSAPIWSSMRQQAGRGGESAGYLWDTDYISCC